MALPAKSALRAKLIELLSKQNPALAALVAAPEAPQSSGDAILAKVFAQEPWAREALAAVEEARPGTAKRYMAAFFLYLGPDENVLAQLRNEAASLCPF